MERITAEGLSRSTKHLRLGDVVYMPNPDPYQVLKDSKQVSHDPFWELPPAGDKDTGYAQLILLELKCEIDFPDLEFAPEVETLPPALRGHLERKRILGEGFEPYVLVPHLPRTGISYGVEESGLVERVVRLFGLGRLREIRQLAFLHDPVVAASGSVAWNFPFHHTRFVHSLDVMAIANLILANLGMSEKMRDIGRIAALTHDALTPAGGDTTKAVDPAAFDEDAHYPELLKGSDWERFRDAYLIPEELLVDTVQGKGVLGQVLDIADKTAYLARDSNEYLGRVRIKGVAPYSDAFADISRYLKAYPHVFSIWDAVELRGSDVVITSPDRLAHFLRIRARMFRDLYFHPGSRFMEYTISQIIVKAMYDSGEITREDLLRMTDAELEKKIDARIGIPNFSHILNSFYPKMKRFGTVEEAAVYEASLRKIGVRFIARGKAPQTTKPGTHMLVLKNGRVSSFKDAYPDEALEIEGQLSQKKPVWLYYLRNSDVPESLLRDLEYVRGRGGMIG